MNKIMMGVPAVILHHDGLITHSEDSLPQVSCPCRQWTNFYFSAYLWCDHHLQELKASKEIPLLMKITRGDNRQIQTHIFLINKEISVSSNWTTWAHVYLHSTNEHLQVIIFNLDILEEWKVCWTTYHSLLIESEIL